MSGINHQRSMRSLREGVLRSNALKAIAATAIVAAAGLSAASPANASWTYYQIKNWHSGKCVDVAGGSPAIGANIQQYTCNGTVAQQWTRAFTDSGYFQLRAAVSGQCMEVKDSSFADNAPVVQKPCTGAWNQQWIQRTSGVSGWPSLVVRHSGKGLVIQSESLLNGVQAVQYQLGWDGAGSLHSMDWQLQ